MLRCGDDGNFLDIFFRFLSIYILITCYPVSNINYSHVCLDPVQSLSADSCLTGPSHVWTTLQSLHSLWEGNVPLCDPTEPASCKRNRLCDMYANRGVFVLVQIGDLQSSYTAAQKSEDAFPEHVDTQQLLKQLRQHFAVLWGSNAVRHPSTKLGK